MKKLIFSLLIVLSALSLVKCLPDVDAVVDNDPQETVFMTVTAGSSEEATKTEITDDTAGSLSIIWSRYDKLYVVGSIDGYLGCLTIRDKGATGTYTAQETFSGTVNGFTSGPQNIHIFYLGKTDRTASGDGTMTSGLGEFSVDLMTGRLPDGETKSEWTLDAIEDKCYIARATILNQSSVPSNYVNVTLDPLISIAKFDLSAFNSNLMLYGTNLYKTGVLDLKAGNWKANPGTAAVKADIENPIVFYPTDTIGTDVINPKVISGTETAENTVYLALVPAATSLNFIDANKIKSYNRTITAGKFIRKADGSGLTITNDVYTGASGGIFRVKSGDVLSAPIESNYVRFAKSNLQYNEATTAYFFADNQYEYSDEDGVGMFGYEYDSWNEITISNGAGRTWRIPTAVATFAGDTEEWNYILKKRRLWEQQMLVFCNIEGVNGVIIFPDLWIKPNGVVFNSPVFQYGIVPDAITTDGPGFEELTFTIEEWTSLENAGAVFLPCIDDYCEYVLSEASLELFGPSPEGDSSEILISTGGSSTGFVRLVTNCPK